MALSAAHTVEKAGDYSLRAILGCLWSRSEWSSAVRVELFDDQIESLRQFDVATQRGRGHQSDRTFHADGRIYRGGNLARLLFIPNDRIVVWNRKKLKRQAFQYLIEAKKADTCWTYDDLRQATVCVPAGLGLSTGRRPVLITIGRCAPKKSAISEQTLPNCAWHRSMGR